MRIILFLTFLLCPLIVSKDTSELFEYPKMLFIYSSATILLGLWAFKSVRETSLTIPKTKLNLPLGIFLLSVIFSTAFALDWETAVFGYYTRFTGGLVPTLSFFIIFFSLLTFIKKSQIQTILHLSLFGAAIISLYALLQKLGLDEGLWQQVAKDRVFSTLGQPNWLAAYLVALIPVNLSLTLTERNPRRKLLLALQLILSLTATIFTFSITGLLALVVSLLLFLSLSKPHLKRWLLMIFLLFLMGGAIINQKQQLMDRAQNTGNIRLIVWQGTTNTFKKAPIWRQLIGYGPSNFAYVFLPFRPAALNLTPEWDLLFNKPHNEYLDLLINQGLLGLISFLLLSATIVTWFSNFLRRNNRDSLLIGLFTGWLTLLITSFFGFLVIPTTLLFWAIPALAFIYTDQVKFRSFSLPESSPFKVGSQILVILGITISFVFITRFYSADVSYASARRFAATGRYLESFLLFQKAVDLNPLVPHYPRDYAATLIEYVAQDKSNNELPQNKFIKEAEINAEKTLALNPLNSLSLRSLSSTYLNLGQIDPIYFQEGLAITNAAITHIPTDTTLYLLKATYLMNMGNLEEARSVLRAAQQLKPDHPQLKSLENTLKTRGMGSSE